jgi:beta-galactosidase
VFQPLEFSAIDLVSGKIKILNRNFFSSTARYTFSWEIATDKGVVQSGAFDLPETAAGKTSEAIIKYKAFTPEPGAEYRLTVRAREKEITPFAASGFEIAWQQFDMPQYAAPKPAATAKGKIDMKETDGTLILTAGGCEAAISKTTGYITSYKSGGRSLIIGDLRPNFWRALTDNDWRGWKAPQLVGFWETASANLELKSFKTSQRDGATVVEVEKSIAGKCTLTLRYTFESTGRLNVDYHLNIDKDTPEPLRIGMQTEVAGELGNVDYYGLGPWENYSDRKAGALMGVYRTTVKDMMWQYLYPQENGNRCNSRWILLSGGKSGIVFAGSTPLNVSAWNCTQEALHKARHPHEIETLPASFIVNIDHAQIGVGGTDTWSNKALASEQYRLLEKTYAYSFVIASCKDRTQAIELGRSFFTKDK